MVTMENAMPIGPMPTFRLSATRGRNTACDICCALMQNIVSPPISAMTHA